MVVMGHAPMTMNYTTILCFTFLHLLLPISCLHLPLSSAQMLVEDKVRLGSIPPNCHSRCNRCDPCRAIQVPTVPGRADRAAGPARGGRFPTRPLGYKEMYERYSNYKPLGWKCRCGDRLYNP